MIRKGSEVQSSTVILDTGIKRLTVVESKKNKIPILTVENSTNHSLEILHIKNKVLYRTSDSTLVH